MASQESRSEPRVQVVLVARYRSPTSYEYVEERCFDLSSGGMFIESTAPAPAGTLLKLDCDVDSGAGRLRGLARVVWLRERGGERQPMGMGVRFLKLEPGGRDLIQRLVGDRASLLPAAEHAGPTPGELTVAAPAAAVARVDVQQAPAPAAAAAPETPRGRGLPFLIAIAAGLGLIVLALAQRGAPPEEVKSEPLPLRAEPPAAELPTAGTHTAAPEPAATAAPAAVAAPAARTPLPAPTKPAAPRPDPTATEPVAGAPEPAPEPAAATTPAQPEPATAQSPLEVAMACLATGDNPCVVRALEGKAKSPRELELLIETHRAMGDGRKAEQLMQGYVDAFPSDGRSVTYKRQLELKAAQNLEPPLER